MYHMHNVYYPCSVEAYLMWDVFWLRSVTHVFSRPFGTLKKYATESVIIIGPDKQTIPECKTTNTI